MDSCAGCSWRVRGSLFASLAVPYDAGEGQVFVWGYGILGKGPKLMESALPEMIPPTLFGLSQFSPDVQVTHIRCGLSHFAAITSKYETAYCPWSLAGASSIQDDGGN